MLGSDRMSRDAIDPSEIGGIFSHGAERIMRNCSDESHGGKAATRRNRYFECSNTFRHRHAHDFFSPFFTFVSSFLFCLFF